MFGCFYIVACVLVWCTKSKNKNNKRKKLFLHFAKINIKLSSNLFIRGFYLVGIFPKQSVSWDFCNNKSNKIVFQSIEKMEWLKWIFSLKNIRRFCWIDATFIFILWILQFTAVNRVGSLIIKYIFHVFFYVCLCCCLCRRRPFIVHNKCDSVHISLAFIECFNQTGESLCIFFTLVPIVNNFIACVCVCIYEYVWIWCITSPKMIYLNDVHLVVCAFFLYNIIYGCWCPNPIKFTAHFIIMRSHIFRMSSLSLQSIHLRVAFCVYEWLNINLGAINRFSLPKFTTFVHRIYSIEI